MFDLVDLQHKLQESRNEVRPPSRIRMRTAAIDKAHILLESGLFSPEEVSYFQQIPMSEVLAEKARMEQHEEMKRRYRETLTIDLPGQLAHVSIFES